MTKYMELTENGKALTGGLINDTWLVEEGGKKVVLQKINTNVFPRPDQVMENMLAVTEFIKEKLSAQGRDPLRETLTFLSDKDGHYLSIKEDGIYRRSLFIEDTFTLEQPGNAEQMWEAGRLFGDFQSLLSDFPVEKLHETLPGFHDTAKRHRDFEKSVEEDAAGRCASVENEIPILRGYSWLAKYFSNSDLPIRVTHNDTKIANLLFDKTTGKALAVIDLETVMPGLSVLDFGDAIRSGASSVKEDDPDIDKVCIIPELYQAYKEGFLYGAGGKLTRREEEELDFGAAVIIYEQALRFLTDYLNGDIYYKINYPDHNLIRAKNQIRLLQSFFERILKEEREK